MSTVELLSLLADLKALNQKLDQLIGMSTVMASEITTFFETSTRAGNDAANKTRERVLASLNNPAFLCDPVYGSQWTQVRVAWNQAMAAVAKASGIPDYDSLESKPKGGRGAHYDLEVFFKKNGKVVASRKIEFKNGGSGITDLPQFLSLQAKAPLFSVTYDAFYYENHLALYLACDPGLTVTKPPLSTYLKAVTGTTYTHPFFAQLKERESIEQDAKNAVVNGSITDYLTKHGASLNLKAFESKVQETQTDKYYVLWNKGVFVVESLDRKEMTDLSLGPIKNGNVLVVQGPTKSYHMLLRWRNHKGILNPAWQISLKQ
jgi:hypothetical protein